MSFEYKDKENLTNEVKSAGREFLYTLLLWPTHVILALGFHDEPVLGRGGESRKLGRSGIRMVPWLCQGGFCYSELESTRWPTVCL